MQFGPVSLEGEGEIGALSRRISMYKGPEAQENGVFWEKGKVHKACPKGVTVTTVDSKGEAKGEPTGGPAWMPGSALGTDVLMFRVPPLTVPTGCHENVHRMHIDHADDVLCGQAGP